MTKPDPFEGFQSSPEIIRLAVMLYVRFPLSLRNVEDLLHERGVDVSHETIRFWWHRFGPMFAAEIRKRRIEGMKSSRWRWHLDEVFVKIYGETHYLWRAVDHEGEVLESYVTKTRDKKAALKFLRKALRRHGRADLKKNWRQMKTPRDGVGKDGFRRYFARKQDCSTCALKEQCTPNQVTRKISRHVHEAARDAARRIVTTDAYADGSRRRKKVEMLFAHLKRILRLDRLRLRGPNGVRDEFLLLAATA